MTMDDLVILIIEARDFSELKRDMVRLLKIEREEDKETDRWADQQEDMNP